MASQTGAAHASRAVKHRLPIEDRENYKKLKTVDSKLEESTHKAASDAFQKEQSTTQMHQKGVTHLVQPLSPHLNGSTRQHAQEKEKQSGAVILFAKKGPPKLDEGHKLKRIDSGMVLQSVSKFSNRDVFSSICKFVPIKEIARMSLVCKSWKTVFRSRLSMIFRCVLPSRCEQLALACLRYNESRIKSREDIEVQLTIDTQYYSPRQDIRKQSWESDLKQVKEDISALTSLEEACKQSVKFQKKLTTIIQSHDTVEENLVCTYGNADLPVQIMIHIARRFEFKKQIGDMGHINELSENTFIAMKYLLSKGGYKLKNSSFEFCHIRINKVPFQDCHLLSFLNALESCGDLRKLVLYDNALTEASVPALKAFCIQNGITELDVNNNLISEKSIKELQGILDANRHG